MPDIINLYEAKTHLSKLVDRAAAGEEIVIAKNGKALAKLAPITIKGERQRRKPAGALGLIFLSPDFDDPLPAEIQAAFDGLN